MVADWERFEQHVNTLLELDGTVSSGSQWHDKGDGTNRDMYDGNPFRLLVDAKTTVRGSYSVSAKEMARWARIGVEAGKRFVLPIRFLPSNSRPQTDVVVLSLDDFAELVELAKRGASRGN
jgi:hypothetical protein